jgi:hypothetical protein
MKLSPQASVRAPRKTGRDQATLTFSLQPTSLITVHYPKLVQSTVLINLVVPLFAIVRRNRHVSEDLQ